MRKQFNLQDWLKDKRQKVETRNGLPAHYIGLDRAGWQVFEIFRANGTSEYKTYHDSYLYSGPGDSPFDLFLVTPEPELTPLEDLLSTYLKNDFEYFSTKKWDEKKWNEVMRIQAAELLSLARKQLQPEIDEAYKTADEVMYRKGKEDGIVEARNDISARIIALKQAKDRAEEALKDLPRWREWDNGAAGNSEGRPIALVSGAGGIRFVSVLGVTGEKYIMLDDLKKLPGFKED